MKETVSVIITTHNSSKTIEATLNSIQKQTYQKIELIIVDDFSRDETTQILKKFENESVFNVKIIFLDKNVGVAGARNIGIKNANGDYLSFLDSDDVWLPEKVSEQIEWMKRNNSHFSFTNYFTINEDGKRISKRYLEPREYSIQDFLYGNPAGLLTVMIKKEGLDISFPNMHHEDYAAWINVIKQCKRADLIDQCNSEYRVHSSISSNKLKAFMWTVQIFRTQANLKGIPLCKSVVLYVTNIIRRQKKVDS